MLCFFQDLPSLSISGALSHLLPAGSLRPVPSFPCLRPLFLICIARLDYSGLASDPPPLFHEIKTPSWTNNCEISPPSCSLLLPLASSFFQGPSAVLLHSTLTAATDTCLCTAGLPRDTPHATPSRMLNTLQPFKPPPIWYFSCGLKFLGPSPTKLHFDYSLMQCTHSRSTITLGDPHGGYTYLPWCVCVCVHKVHYYGG